jgi:hypothetical protein
LEISKLSDADYALINATWLNLTNEDFQCKRTEGLLSNRSDAEVAIKAIRQKKGCGVITKHSKVEIDSIAFHSCLCHENFQHPLMGSFLTLETAYSKGTLPFTGGLMDQPAQIIDILSLISSLRAEHDLDIQTKAAKKNK